MSERMMTTERQEAIGRTMTQAIDEAIRETWRAVDVVEGATGDESFMTSLNYLDIIWGSMATVAALYIPRIRGVRPRLSLQRLRREWLEWLDHAIEVQNAARYSQPSAGPKACKARHPGTAAQT